MFRGKKALALFCLLLFVFGQQMACNRVSVCKQSYNISLGSLRPTWNVIKRQKNPAMLASWLDRFLTTLLNKGDFFLEDRGSHYLVVSTNTFDADRCQMSVASKLEAVGDDKVLTKLHAIVKKYKINMDKYLYRPPKTYTVYKVKSKKKIWDCETTKYRVDLSYWKTISTKYTKSEWGEACALGRKLMKWKPCFEKSFIPKFEDGMDRVCGKKFKRGVPKRAAPKKVVPKKTPPKKAEKKK